MAKLKPVEVGQTVYVNHRQNWLKNEPNLREAKVVRVNGTSFYVATEKGSERGVETKLSRRNWTGEDFIFHYKAYETAEKYWDMIKRVETKILKANKIKAKLSSLTLEQLEQIESIMGQEE